MFYGIKELFVIWWGFFVVIKVSWLCLEWEFVKNTWSLRVRVYMCAWYFGWIVMNIYDVDNWYLKSFVYVWWIWDELSLYEIIEVMNDDNDVCVFYVKKTSVGN